MRTEFHKYHGTGNDFVLIDARADNFRMEDFTPEVRRNICHRRLGIGADGLIFLCSQQGTDFYMDYYNSDGAVSSMCGNGSRCIVHMAHELGLTGNKVTFEAVDGPHQAHIDGDMVSVLLNTGKVYQLSETTFRVDTGSPHFIKYVEDLDRVDVVLEGRAIRNSDDYRTEGINVNFVKRLAPMKIAIATYERGVEDETLSCGTGVTASALTELELSQKEFGEVEVKARGGDLKVRVRSGENGREVWLCGPARFVFKGELDTDHFNF